MPEESSSVIEICKIIVLIQPAYRPVGFKEFCLIENRTYHRREVKSQLLESLLLAKRQFFKSAAQIPVFGIERPQLSEQQQVNSAVNIEEILILRDRGFHAVEFFLKYKVVRINSVKYGMHVIIPVAVGQSDKVVLIFPQPQIVL